MAEDFLTNFQYSRQQQRYTNLSGVTPTMPVLTGATMTGYTEADNMVLGNFIDTDILDSEIFLNTADDRVFIRSNDTILEFLMSGSTGATYNSGNGITIGTGNTINLGGNLTSNVFIDGLSGSSSMYLGSYGPDKQLSTFSVGANNGISLFNYENNIITSSLGLSDSGVNIFSDVITGTTTVGGGNFLLTTGGGSGNTATVMTPGPGALKYDADYSSGYTSLSLITKNDLDNAISGATLASGNAITIGTGNTIDLGGAITQPVTILSGSSTEVLDIGGNTSNNLAQVRINSTSFQSNHLTAYNGTGIGTYINTNPGGFSSVNTINSTSRTEIANSSSNAGLYNTSNKIVRLFFNGPSGIPNGSGESFTLNGTTFTEGIDFTGQGNAALDAATIAALDYSGVTYFDSVTDEGSGFVRFNFTLPVQVSETFTYVNFLVFNWESSVQTDDTGVTIKVGDDDFYGTPGTILAIGDSETIFTDNSAIPKGIQYGANYDATLVDDSLTTKRYVDNAITAATDNNYYTTGSTLINDIIYFDRNDTLSAYTADLTSLVSGLTLTGGNGITIGTGNTINLGGLLTQSTTISGNSVDLDIGVTGSELSFLNIRSLQAQEQYKFAGEGLVVTKNPGQFMTELDYTATLGEKTTSQQTPINISTTVISNSGNTTSQIVQTPGVINLLTNTDESTLSDSGLILDQSADSFRFVDNRLAHRGLEYDADYSSGYTSLSLITKGDLDNAITAITDNNYYTTGTTLIGNTIYFDRNDTLSAYTADLTSIISGATFSGGSGNCISDLYVTNIHGCSPITIKDELIIESGITGTGNIDITGNVISDVVQLRGGVGTQGEMSWSTDEETVQLIMDGTTLHIGQDTFVHARNNTASIITKGTAVYATGTLGASGRITVAPMIANGTIPGRYFIGLAAENIAIGADGQVCSYGKIKGLNTNTYTDGDVLWLSPTVAGGLTTTEPTAPNLKIATAFVIHAATNGILMVRAEQGNDLHSDQRVQVSGLANNDVLTWNNANQRWQNAQPTSSNIYTTNGTIGSGRVATLTDTLSINNSSNVTNLQFKNKSVGIKGDNLLVTPGDVVDQALNLKYQTSTNTAVIIPIGTSGSGKGNLNLQANRTTIENIWTNDDVKINGNSLSIGAVRTIEIPFSTDGSWKGINLRTIQENGGGARLEIQTSPGGLGGTYQNALVINKNTNIDITGRVTMSTTTDGILLPRLTTAQMNAISSPITNLIVYNTDLGRLYRYNGSGWVPLIAGLGNQTTTSTATLTINSNLEDLGIITAQAAALTIAAPTGTPAQGQKLIFRIKDNGTARGITWNAIFRALGTTLPTTTVINKTTYVGCIYNSTDTKWDVVVVNTEA